MLAQIYEPSRGTVKISGKTNCLFDIMVLSTHDNTTIKEFCNKALWLEKGEIKLFGPVDEVLQHKAEHEYALSS